MAPVSTCKKYFPSYPGSLGKNKPNIVIIFLTPFSHYIDHVFFGLYLIHYIRNSDRYFLFDITGIVHYIYIFRFLVYTYIYFFNTILVIIFAYTRKNQLIILNNIKGV